MAKKILILGGGHSEIPLINAAKNKGYYVITSGNNETGLGHKFSDKYINCDFSDKNAILDIAKIENIDGIVSGCNDFSLLTTTWVAEKLGFKSHDNYETAKKLHLKDEYRKIAFELGIKAPKIIKYYANTSIELITKKLEFPMIVKPVDLTGGKGITKVLDKNELKSALELALKKTKKDYVIAEEFIEGTNHGFSAFIKNHKIIFYFLDDEQYFLNKYLVSGTCVDYNLSSEIKNKLIEYSEMIAKHLNLVDGIFHVQFISDKKNEPVIIEITRRCPGDLYPLFAQYSTGFPFAENVIDSELGIEIFSKTKLKQRNIIRHCIMPVNNGIIKQVNIDNSLKKYYKDSLYWWKKGYKIEDMYSYKAGIIFLEFENDLLMKKTLSLLSKLITIELED